jgi:mRNA interferase YafQ
MRGLHLTSTFKKDLKRILRRGYRCVHLDRVVDRLRLGMMLDSKHRDHPLQGKWTGWRECHIQSNWVLVYKIVNEEVIVDRTGTHSDVFNA